MQLCQVVKQYSSYGQMLLKLVNWNYGNAVLSSFFLALQEESDENDDSDFKILLHFETAIVAEWEWWQ